MSSLFDDIFHRSADVPVNPLFSSNSKFKVANAAGAVGTEQAVKPAEPAVSQITGKKAAKSTSSKKRKAVKALDLPAVSEQPAKQKHKKQKTTAGSGTAHITTHASKKRKAASEDANNADTEAAVTARSSQKATPEAKANNASTIMNGMRRGKQVTAEETARISTDEGEAASDAKAKRLSPVEEAAKLRRTVFVGNLPSAVKRKMVQREFDQYGSIESIRRRSVPVALDAKMSRKAAIITGNVSDKRGTSHAYVVFQDEAAALAALASNMHMVDGRHIRVDRAGQSAHGSTGGSVVYERNRTLFIGNLPFDVEDEELIVFFNDKCTELGIPEPVEAVRVVRDSASQLGKGFGFVQFKDQPAARAALGCDGQLLRKRPVRVTKAVKVPAHLKVLGKKEKLDRKPVTKDGGDKRQTSAAGVMQSTPSNKAVAALQRQAEPAENWQGFKTKGSKKTTAGPTIKGTSGAGQRPVEGKRKAPEKRPSVVMRKQRSLAK